MSDQSPSSIWGEFRQKMPVTERWVYLDHAAVAPLPTPTHDAIAKWAREATQDGAIGWAAWSARLEELRTSASLMIGAAADEVALVQNTTAGIGLVAEGFPWQQGDNVVTLANEFPSNLYPWLNLESRGVETRRVEVDNGRVDLDRLAAACDDRTRIVAASWVGFASGWRNDPAELARVAHDHGALLMLDAIQGLGVYPLDVRDSNVDFLAADGHKWMLGPEGAGLFYARREHIDKLHPLGVGWNSVVRSYDFDHVALDLKPGVARFEGGSHNMAGFIGLAASLDLLTSIGADHIGQRLLELTDMACECLEIAGATIVSHREGDHRSGIVAFRWDKDDMSSMRHKLLKKGVLLSYRGGCLRISPHCYNDQSDIERLVEALKDPE